MTEDLGICVLEMGRLKGSDGWDSGDELEEGGERGGER